MEVWKWVTEPPNVCRLRCVPTRPSEAFAWRDLSVFSLLLMDLAANLKADFFFLRALSVTLYPRHCKTHRVFPGSYWYFADCCNCSFSFYILKQQLPLWYQMSVSCRGFSSLYASLHLTHENIYILLVLELFRVKHYLWFPATGRRQWEQEGLGRTR